VRFFEPQRRVGAIILTIFFASCRDSRPDDSPIAAHSSPGVKTGTSAGAQSYEDSILDALPPGRTVVTRSGDTLLNIGGGMLDEEYGAGEYRKNSATYVIIERSLGHKSNGMPIWSTRARLLLPPMDSTQTLFFAGMCGIDDKSDPFVLAIPAAGPSDSVYRNIRHAWRFDRATETLQVIQTSRVSCWDVGAD
jgi:hypothetical protein